MIGKMSASGLRGVLADFVVTHELEHKIAFLITLVARIEQVLELGIELQPTVRVPITLVPHPVWMMRRLARSGVHDHARHRDARAHYQQACRVVHVLPEAITTATKVGGACDIEVRSRGRSGGSDHRDIPSSWLTGNSDIPTPDPAPILAGGHVIVASLARRGEERQLLA